MLTAKQIQSEKRRLSDQIETLSQELMPLLAKVESLRAQIRVAENNLSAVRDSKFKNRETR